MRRELIIVLAVLVPFGALVGVAYLYTAPGPVEAPSVAAAPAVAPAPTPARPAAAQRTPDAGTSGPPAVARGKPPAPAQDPPPPAIEAPIAAVYEAVATCFDDERAHARKVDITVDFTPTRDGKFQRVTVSSDRQSPYLIACVEDVFAEATFRPNGHETFVEGTYTFHFQGEGR